MNHHKKAQPQEQSAPYDAGSPVPLTLVGGLLGSFGGGFVFGKLTEGPLKSQVGEIDHRTTRAIQRAAGPGTDQLMALASGAGEPRTLYPLAGILAVRWLAEKRPEDSAALAAAILGSAALDGALKRVVKRPRPLPILHRQGSSGSSFPSNHTVMGLATYGLIAHVIVRRWHGRGREQQRKRLAVWALAMLLVVLISWSRVYQGVHRSTDSLGGWLVGGIWLLVCARLADRGARD